MSNIPKRTLDRLVAGIKRFQPILASAKARDVNESDTVILVTDMLSDVYGYDKYSDLTSEHAIRGTFCDLAIRVDGTLQLLIEVKAIGLHLKDSHVKQAVDYAANQGVDWVVLTNGEHWRIYKVTFAKPIDQELVCEFEFSKIEPKTGSHLEILYSLSKEGWQKSALGDLHERKQALSRFFLAAIIQSDIVIELVRRELRRVSPNVHVEVEEIRAVLLQDVLKREVLEGDKAEWAKKHASKAANRSLRAKSNDKEIETVAAEPCANSPATPAEPAPVGQ